MRECILWMFPPIGFRVWGLGLTVCISVNARWVRFYMRVRSAPTLRALAQPEVTPQPPYIFSIRVGLARGRGYGVGALGGPGN